MVIARYAPLVLLALAWGCSGSGSHQDNEDSHEGHSHSHEGHSHERHSHEGNSHEGHSHSHEGHSHSHGEDAHGAGAGVDVENDILVAELEPETARRLGVVTEVVRRGDFAEALAVGAVVEPSAASQAVLVADAPGIVTYRSGITQGSQVARGTVVATIDGSTVAGGDANARAWAEYDAARQEVDRLAPLHADGIVSTRDYNAAVARMNTLKAACTASPSGGAVTATTSGTVVSLDVAQGAYVQAGEPVATIATGSGALLKVSVPARHAALASAAGGFTLQLPGSEHLYSSQELGARARGDARVVVNGYIQLYYTVDSPTLLPGMTARVYLEGQTHGGVLSVPVGAVDEEQGTYWVYVKLDEDCYRKTPVTTGRRSGSRVEITSGLQGGEDIVVEGRTMVRMAFNNGAVPEGHSHSH